MKKRQRPRPGTSARAPGPGLAHRDPERYLWILLLPAITASFLLRPKVIRDADVFWHLATGRHILQSHSIPFTDPFSFTAASQLWVDHEWLYQVLLHLIHMAGGIWLMFLTKIAFYTAAFLVPAWWAFRREGSAAAAAIAATLCLVAALPFSEYRPVMVSMVLLALVHEQGRRLANGDKRQILILPAVFALWANLHATFLLGIASIGAWGLENLFRRKGLKLLLIAGTVAVGSTLFNPYGYHVWLTPFKVTGSALFLQQNEEWRPPDLSREFLGLYVLVPVIVAAMAVKRKISADTVLAVLFIAACFKSRRMVPYLAVAAVPLIAAAATHLLAMRRLRPLAVAAVLVLLIVAGAVWSYPLAHRASKHVGVAEGLPFLTGSFPDTCAKTLRSIAPQGRVFNDYNHGGFLHYMVGPQWKVFIDGRNDLYGEQLTRLYEQIATGIAEWRSVFDQDGINAALVSYDIASLRPVNLALDLQRAPQWSIVHFDDAGILFIRRKEKPAGLPEFQTFRPALLYEEQRDELINSGKLKLCIEELSLRARQDRCRIAELALVQALIDDGQLDAARVQMRQTVEHFGTDAYIEELLKLL